MASPTNYYSANKHNQSIVPTTEEESDASSYIPRPLTADGVISDNHRHNYNQQDRPTLVENGKSYSYDKRRRSYDSHSRRPSYSHGQGSGYMHTANAHMGSTGAGAYYAGSPSGYNHRHGVSMLTLSPREIEESLNARYENLQEMRPYHLIGKSVPLQSWEKFRKSDEEIKSIKNKKVRKFYENQNELIDRFIEVDKLLDSGIPVSMLRVYGDDLQQFHINPQDSRQGAPANIDTESTPLMGSATRQEQSRIVMFAIYINFFINFVLLLGKILVAILTNSLSILASLVDSVLDFLSTLIIWFSTRLVEQRDWRTRHDYPVGRSRLEPIGVLVFSVLIIVSFLQIGNQAVQKLAQGDADLVVLTTASIVIMIMTILVKFLCWIWCRSIKSSAVQALAQDAMTDIVFNTFSILFPLVGHYFKIWWFDPFGALCLSCYIIFCWGATALSHIDNLTGTAASQQDRQVLLYASYRFAESIKQITTLNAYHTGDRVMVEVDLVLDGTLSLKDSHDIGEALQYALETLPFVERAFVHLDYRTGNFTGHIDR